MAVVLESDCRKATDGGTQRLINFESSNDVPMDRFRSAAPEAFLSVISMRRAAECGFPTDRTNVSRSSDYSAHRRRHRWLYRPVPDFVPLSKAGHFGPLSRNPSLGFGFYFEPMKACHAALIEHMHRHAAAIIGTDSVPLHAQRIWR